MAGGKGQRLGKNKAFVKLDSKTLLEMVLSCTQGVVEEIILVVDQPEKFSFLHKNHLNLKIVRDKIPDQGPLGGLLTGLELSEDFYNLTLSCDTPFVQENLCRYLLSQTVDFDAVVPQINNKIEPLLAVYSKNCIGPILESLTKKDLKIISFFSKVRVKYIGIDNISRYDPELISFFNVNTKEDLKKSRQIYQKLLSRKGGEDGLP